jgi:NAD(P)-dependent dehydrogenase (short-subunit alcohol dehydrogenase family)
MDLKDKVAIITGGASGIGAACARAFAAQGAKVCIADINGDGAKAVASEFGGLGVACDVGSETAINSLVDEATEKLGPVDVFFNNAAIANGTDPLSTPLSVWQRQWDINVMAHVYAIRAVLPGMLDRGSGYFLHTTSMAGILTSPGNLPYAATKHAVVAIAEWMAMTYHADGIRTSLLAPLGVRTPMLGDYENKNTSGMFGPISEPEEVADMVVSAMNEERFMILTDQVAQKWMERKTSDIERWLGGMRRLTDQIRQTEAETGSS